MTVHLISAFERIKPDSPDPSTYRLPRTVAVFKSSRKRVYVVPFGGHAVKMLDNEQEFLKYFAHKHIPPEKRNSDLIDE